MERWVLSTTIPDTEKNRRSVEAGIKHDWALYQKNLMVEPTLAEWLRFLINKRFAEIREGRL